MYFFIKFAYFWYLIIAYYWYTIYHIKGKQHEIYAEFFNNLESRNSIPTLFRPLRKNATYH